jgi:hypothetical protein
MCKCKTKSVVSLPLELRNILNESQYMVRVMYLPSNMILHILLIYDVMQMALQAQCSLSG